MIVEAQIGDSVTVLDAFLLERRRKPFAALTELGIGTLPLTGNDPDLLAKQIDGTM